VCIMGLLVAPMNSFSMRMASIYRRQTRTRVFARVQQPEWMDRGEEIVRKSDDSGELGRLSESHGTTLFDTMYTSDGEMDADNSFAACTLREVSEEYGFSLSFLGDYVVELGVYPPVDVDARLRNMLTGVQVYSLMECVNTLDPYESTIEYDSLSLRELAEELGVPTKRALKICTREGFNLPFGLDSILHNSMEAKFRSIHDYDEYKEEEEELSESGLDARDKNADAIDVEVKDVGNTARNIGSQFE